MTHRLLSIGAIVAGLTLTAMLTAAQVADGPGFAGAPPLVQDAAPPAPDQAGPGPGTRRGPDMGPRAGRRGGRPDGAGPQDPTRGSGLGPAALDLTQEQRTQITDLQRAARDQAAPLEDELVFARRTLHRELFADARDNAQVSNLSEKIATLERQLADLRTTATVAMADLLTPEQRETMRLMGDRRGGLGRGPGRPGVGRRGIAGGPPSAGGGARPR